MTTPKNFLKEFLFGPGDSKGDIIMITTSSGTPHLRSCDTEDTGMFRNIAHCMLEFFFDKELGLGLELNGLHV